MVERGFVRVWKRLTEGRNAALEATQGQIDSFSSQLHDNYYLEEVASMGDWLKICPQPESTRLQGGKELMTCGHELFPVGSGRPRCEQERWVPERPASSTLIHLKRPVDENWSACRLALTPILLRCFCSMLICGNDGVRGPGSLSAGVSWTYCIPTGL